MPFNVILNSLSSDLQQKFGCLSDIIGDATENICLNNCKAPSRIKTTQLIHKFHYDIRFVLSEFVNDLFLTVSYNEKRFDFSKALTFFENFKLVLNLVCNKENELGCYDYYMLGSVNVTKDVKHSVFVKSLHTRISKMMFNVFDIIDIKFFPYKDVYSCYLVRTDIGAGMRVFDLQLKYDAIKLCQKWLPSELLPIYWFCIEMLPDIAGSLIPDDSNLYYYDDIPDDDLIAKQIKNSIIHKVFTSIIVFIFIIMFIITIIIFVLFILSKL